MCPGYTQTDILTDGWTDGQMGGRMLPSTLSPSFAVDKYRPLLYFLNKPAYVTEVGRSARAQQGHKVDNRIDRLISLLVTKFYSGQDRQTQNRQTHMDGR